MEQYANSPILTASTRAEALSIIEPGNGLLKRAAEQNLLKELPIEMLSSIVFGAIISLIILHLSGVLKLMKIQYGIGCDMGCGQIVTFCSFQAFRNEYSFRLSFY